MTIELFGAVQPTPDVLSGVLSDAVFAASLDEVVAGVAPDAYGNPDVFFAGTYPSAGLKSLLDEVLGRVGGARPDSAPVIRLETNLGGGKTHNLIALYHAARGRLDAMRALEFMDPSNLPAEPVGQVGVFVGTEAGATSFPSVDGITASTVWGYLALQLGGASAYEELRSDDEALTAPGADALKRIMGGRPTLVLIDEIARYLAVAEGRIVGKSTLATQTTAFLMALMEAVAAQPNATVVITTTQVTEAFGDETAKVLEAITDAQQLIARKEHVLRPSEEADLPKILARRLFDTIESQAAASVATAYAETAQAAASGGADLPEQMIGAGFRAEVERCYPFHPQLITVLDKRLSTIPNFHRTRGALRLLAGTVRRLWDSRPEGCCLIHPHHIDMGDRDTVEELTSRLDRPRFEPVVRADIASQPGAEPSHAEDVDHRMGTLYAKRLATAAYLFSLTSDVPGVPAATLFGAVLAPGDDANVMAKALDNLESAAWYLHTDARGYRFSIEPSLTKLIQEAESQVTQGQAKAAATKILADRFRDSALKVRRTWEDAKVPDHDDDAWLVVLHWDEFGTDHGVTDAAAIPPQITSTWEHAPAGGVREYRNRLVFLAPQAASHEAMLRAVRRQIALEGLAGSADALRALSEENRKKVVSMAKESALEAAVAVCNHVNLLYVPQAGGLEPEELDLVTTASVKPNQTEAVMSRLSAMEKTLSEGDKPLDPAWIKQRLGEQLNSSLATLELVRAFARRPDLKLVLDRKQLNDLVVAGVRNGVWEYHDPERSDEGWGYKDHPVAVRLAEETTLEPIGTHPEVKPPEIPHLPPLPPSAHGTGFPATGKADVALRAARQAAVDAKRSSVTGLIVTVDVLGGNAGVELARALSVVPPTMAGATVSYNINFTSALGGPTQTLRVEFKAPAAEYQALRSAFDHVLRENEATLRATVTAAFDPALELSGQELEDLIGRAGDTGPGKCEVEITTETDK
jgi:hypothetical protein